MKLPRGEKARRRRVSCSTPNESPDVEVPPPPRLARKRPGMRGKEGSLFRALEVRAAALGIETS